VQRIKALTPIVLLLGFFFILRLLIPHALNNDEAEQVLAAQEFLLGYPKQPPLYSWLVKSFTLVLGYKIPNIYILNSLKFFFFAVFLYFLYLSAELVFGTRFHETRELTENQEIEVKEHTNFNPALLVLSSVLLFVTYFYDFMRDLTHSILAAMFSAIAFYIYLKLWLRPSFSKYVLLGLCFGLGFLAKYNFIFFALSIVAASLVERKAFKILFNWRTLVSLLVCLLVFSPNLIYLLDAKLSAVNYALERSGSSISQVASAKFIGLNTLKLLFSAFYEIILVLGLLTLLFYPVIQWVRAKNYFFTDDILVTAKLRRYVFFLGVFSVCIPLLIMLSMGAAKFYAKWLSASSFLVVFSFFTLIDFKHLVLLKDFKFRKIILYSAVSICFIVSASVFILAGFFPDLIGKVAKTQYPYAKILKVLQNEGGDSCVIVINNDPVLEANLKLEAAAQQQTLRFCRSRESLSLVNSKNDTGVASEKLLYIWDAKLYGHEIPKVFRHQLLDKGYYHFYKIYKLKYINSKKQFYELGVVKL